MNTETTTEQAIRAHLAMYGTCTFADLALLLIGSGVDYKDVDAALDRALVALGRAGIVHMDTSPARMVNRTAWLVK